MKANTDIRRAASALDQAITARPGDVDHPGYEQLEALVDGRLDDADREIVETHAELCEVCRQDVDDMVRERDAMRAPASAPVFAPTRVGRAFPMRALQIAAVLLAVVGVAMFARQFGQNVAGDLQVPGTDATSPPGTDATSPPGSAATSAANAPAVTASSAPADALTADERALVDRVLASGSLEMPAAVRSLTAPVGTLLGVSREALSLEPLSPVGTAVLSVTPRFSWTAVAGATSYSVAVYDEQFREVVRSPLVTGASWTPTVVLSRGATLAWQVTAHFPTHDVLAPQPPQPEARFVVADAATDAAIAAQQARLSDQPLALGVLLAKAGLFLDATRELQRAAAQPDTADRANALLASLKK